MASAACPAPLARYDQMLDGSLDLGDVIEMHTVLDELESNYERAVKAAQVR
ncbi:hypothetical protein [Pseudomonas sp. dw_358]|uniref:DUF6889 family protein n=1 Tax=Pseudomonas sp. dw_358 TaxID=2720083 RepID=UPI001BD56170|nr:hypothetical protein [Pseudomonas sp. dw_358]